MTKQVDGESTCKSVGKAEVNYVKAPEPVRIMKIRRATIFNRCIDG